MRDIVIYRAEKEIPGLAERVAKSMVLAYTVPLVKWEPDKKTAQFLANAFFSNQASLTDSDLYYTKSVFVTTNWNKNTDVFDKAETWAARHTPVHKPTNVEHSEQKLVGHITDCWAVTLDGEPIPDNIDIESLPNVYHLVNGAVIYRGWRDQDLADRARALIEEIEAGKKFVSMECAFTNFSYAVIKDNGECSVIERSEGTAWMTKHLRAYGGTGEYEGCKIGRLLRNITFTGKGYVDHPANPDSVILSDANLFNFTTATKENIFFSNNGVYSNNAENINEENQIMSSEIDILKTQLDEVRTSLKEALESKATLEERLAKADIAKFESQISSLQTELGDAKKQIENYQNEIQTAKTLTTDVEKSMAELKTTNETLTKQLADMTQAQMVANRVAMLVDGGIKKETAEQKVSLFANLNDEQWSDLSKELVDAVKQIKTETNEDKSNSSEVVEEDETNANTEVLDNMETTNEPNLTVGNEQIDETAEMRKELQKAFASRLGVNIEQDNSTE